MQELTPEIVPQGQWIEAALRVQTISTEMHRMQGVLQAINKSAMSNEEKLKATDAVASGLLATAKLGLAAMQQVQALERLGQATITFRRGDILREPTPTAPRPRISPLLGVPQGGVIEQKKEPRLEVVY